MNTRIVKLYILKALGVASLMASGAVFLVLAATFTSSRFQRIKNREWEYAVNVDRFFPQKDESFAKLFNPKPNPDITSCGLKVVFGLDLYYNSTGRNYIFLDNPLVFGALALQKAGESDSVAYKYCATYYQVNPPITHRTPYRTAR